MFLSALKPKLGHFLHFAVAILKIQDGRLLNHILDNTIGFPIPENMGLDTKIMSLCGLEMLL